jgi:hypothetical protein
MAASDPKRTVVFPACSEWFGQTACTFYASYWVSIDLI